jgi:hypothetical protein
MPRLRSTARHSRRHWPFRSRPALEALEDRCLLVAGGWERIEPLGGLMFQRQESGAFGSNGSVAIVSEDFESQALGPRWSTFSSAPEGRILLSNSLAAPTHGGSFHLTMDRFPAGSQVLNEAILSVDLTGISNADFSFWHKDVFDDDTPLPLVFAGSVVGDGVSISADGTTWHTLVSFNDFNSPANSYTQFTFDLDAAASAGGIALGPNFKIKFQQYDDLSFNSDGRAFDDIVIATPAPPVDQKLVFLESGQKLSLVATPTNGASTLAVRVLSPDGAVLHEATATGPGKTLALQTIDVGIDGIYRVEVTGDAGSPYTLDLYRNAAVEVADTGDGAELDASGSLIPLGSGRYGIFGRFGDAIDPPPPPPTDLSPGVWGIQPATGQIVRIDPVTGNVVDFFAAPNALLPSHTFGGLTIAEEGHSLLYVNPHSGPSNIYRLDPDTGAVLSVEFMPPTAIPEFRAGLSFESGTSDFIFAVDDGSGIDRQTGFGGPLAKHTPSGVTFSGALGGDDNGRMFVVMNGQIAEFNPFIPNVQLGALPLPPSVSEVSGLAFDGANIYLSTPDGRLFTISQLTGSVISQVLVAGGGLTGLAARGGQIPAQELLAMPAEAASELIVNGSFETGDLSGWTAVVTGSPFPPTGWQVSPAGTGTSGFGFDPTQPQEGSFVAWNGFDGAGPLEYTLSQNVTLPAGEYRELSWKDRVQWDFTLGTSSAQPRLVEVQIRHPNTLALLETVYSFSTGTELQNPTGDTGWQSRSVDLSAFAGSTVRIVFREVVPESFSGPGQIEFDAISLGQAAAGPDVDEYLIDLAGKAGRPIDVVLSTSSAPTPEPNIELVTNGDFESGSLAGWTVGPAIPSAGWQINSGSFHPPGPALPLAPIAGNFDVVSFQNGPSLQLLSQAITVPSGVTAATLGWSDRIRNFAGDYNDPFQEWRVRILDAGGVQIAEVFSTDPGDIAQQIGPNDRSFDVTSILQSLAGQVVHLSFEQQDSAAYMNATLDDVSLKVSTATPPPAAATATLELLAPDGITVLATGTSGAGNFDVGILGFVVPTDGTYTVRVSSAVPGNYGIVITDPLVFEREPNDPMDAPLRSLNDVDGALGMVSPANDSADTYSVFLEAGQTIALRTATPFDNPADDLNQLDPALAILAGNDAIVAADLDGADGKNARLNFTAAAAGIYRVVLSAEPGGGAGEYVLLVNHAPVIHSGDIQPNFNPILENDFVTLSGAFADADSEDTHTVDVDWGDGTSSPAIVDQVHRTFTATHPYLDDGLTPEGAPNFIYSITVVVSDGSSSTAALASVEVLNTNPFLMPLASNAGFADAAAVGTPVMVSAAFFDVGTLDAHSAWVDWGDGSPILPAAIVQGSGAGAATASHAYAKGGVFSVTMLLFDDDSGAAVQTATAVVAGAGLNDGVLQIVGTDDNDRVVVTRQGNGQLGVLTYLAGTPGFRRYAESEVNQLEIFLREGNDYAAVAHGVRVPAIVDGGGGNDALFAGGGPTVLVGGDGNDMLVGGPARNILIGGRGLDLVSGASGEDLLVAGRTVYDDDHAALLEIMKEWNADRSYPSRVSNIRQGQGPVLDGTGIKLKKNVTVFDDGQLDLLFGSSGRDWFFFRFPEDFPLDKQSNEAAN